MSDNTTHDRRLNVGLVVIVLALAATLLGGPAGAGDARPGAGPPANDDYADAAPVAALPYSDSVDMAEATTEPTETVGKCVRPRLPHRWLPAAVPGYDTVWYRYQPVVDEQVTFDLSGGEVAGLITVFEGGDLATQTEVACGGSSDNPLVVGLRGGRSYAIQIAHVRGSGTVMSLDMHRSDVPGVGQILPYGVLADDGTALRGHVYLPEGDGPFAPVLEFSPYWNTAYGPSESFTEQRGDHLTLAGWLRPLMDAGFAVALVNMRGTGESGGCLQWGGPLDSSDAATVIEDLAAQPWSNGNVGMYGLSYPGWSQMLALASDDAPSLKAVVPASPITDLWNLLSTNGATLEVLNFRQPAFTAQVATGAMAATHNQLGMFVPDTEPGHVACPRHLEEILHSPPLWNGDRTPYFAERDLRDAIEGTDVAVFATLGLSNPQGVVAPDFEGHFTQLDGIWDLLDGDRRFMFGQWAHGFPLRSDFADLAVEWLHEHLRAEPSDEPRPRTSIAEYQDDTGEWHTSDQWPPAATDTTLWLSDDDLVSDPTAVQPSSRAYQATDQVPCAGFCPRPIGPRVPGCTGDHLVFVSEPLADDLLIAGHYQVDLTVESSLADGTIAAFLYHTDQADPCAADQLHPSGQAISDLRHVADDEGASFPTNTPNPITLTSSALASHIPAGHRLVMTVGSAGWITEPDPFLPRITVTTGPGTVSALTLPVVAGSIAWAHSD